MEARKEMMYWWDEPSKEVADKLYICWGLLPAFDGGLLHGTLGASFSLPCRLSWVVVLLSLFFAPSNCGGYMRRCSRPSSKTWIRSWANSFTNTCFKFGITQKRLFQQFFSIIELWNPRAVGISISNATHSKINQIPTYPKVLCNVVKLP